jgi:hypothetical protein
VDVFPLPKFHCHPVETGEVFENETGVPTQTPLPALVVNVETSEGITVNVVFDIPQPFVKVITPVAGPVAVKGLIGPVPLAGKPILGLVFVQLVPGGTLIIGVC